MEPKHSANKKIALVFLVIALIAGSAYIWKTNQKNSEMENKEETSAPVTAEDSKELEALLKELKNTETHSEINIDNIE